jgi:hypothetical protein
VKGIDISKMEGMNMLEEHDHPLNHRPGGGGYEYGEYPYGGCEGYEYTGGAPVEEGGGYAYGGGAPDKSPVGGGGMDIMEDMMIEMVER